MRKQKNPSPLADSTPRPDTLDSPPKRRLLYVKDPYVEALKREFLSMDRLPLTTASISSLDQVIELIEKARIEFLMELGDKIPLNDYQDVIGALRLSSRPEGTIIVEKGKKPQTLSILIEGEVSYHIESDTTQDLLCVGVASPGHLVYPQVFMTPKFVNFTIICESNCSFLVFNEEIYTRYIKKTLIKDADLLVHFLSRTSLFDGLSTLSIRKYLAYFIPKTFHYNDVIYEADSPVDSISLVLQGEIEICSKANGNSIGLVKLGVGQCFGVDSVNLSTRKYEARCVQSKVKVLTVDLQVLTIIRMENAAVETNYHSFINRIDKLHGSILTKNMQILAKRDLGPIQGKRKRKRKGKKKEPMGELKWWGLAENVKMEQKYRIPTRPRFAATCAKTHKTEGGSPRTLFSHKINDLRRRVLQNELEDYEGECELEEQENMGQTWITTNYSPKMRKKIKMLDPRPKAINVVEVVKKKLLTYARNMGSFCDRLNLE